MTQPGSLATWRRSSEKTRPPANQQRVSYTASDATCYRGTGDGSGLTGVDTIEGGNDQQLWGLLDDRYFAGGIVNDAVCTAEQEAEESIPTVSSFHHHHQQQQQDDMPLQQSRNRCDVITLSDQRPRRRWSEFIPPHTPPCSPLTLFFII